MAIKLYVAWVYEFTMSLILTVTAVVFVQAWRILPETPMLKDRAVGYSR